MLGLQHIMRPQPSALALWTRRLLLRSDLSNEICAAIAALPAVQLSYDSGRDIVRLGELTTGACLIVSGIAGKFHQDSDGLRQVSAVFIAGDMADLHSVPLPKCSAALTALGPTKVVRVPHDAIRALARRYPAFAEACWRDCTVDAQVASEWVFALGRFSAKARLAHFLCEMGLRFERVGGRQMEYALPLTQGFLGEILGLTSVHINRTFRELREAEAVEMRGRTVHILDWHALAAIGQFDPRYLHLEREPRV